jgi:type I restriction enzyme R subunit
LNVLKDVLPTPQGDDYTKGLWESVGLASYRSVAKETMSIALANEEASIGPIPVPTDIGIPVPEMEVLSKIIEEFNKVCGGLGIKWQHPEIVEKQIIDLPGIIKGDESYQAAMESSDEENSHIEVERATKDTIRDTHVASYELQKAVAEHPELLDWIVNHVFRSTYVPGGMVEGVNALNARL